ncbi:hypothetical protein ALC152_03870 [Arcobacter sp. 15-2]|uniref:hypothetical protein n=1 Tax=Arcobacter sp. 15-2 TaxID=3374109 RepID=UPI00399CB673
MKIQNENDKALDSNFYDNSILNNNIVVLNQQVDTLVLHLYPQQKMNEKQLNDYNIFVDDLNELKSQAQAIQGEQVKRFTRKIIKDVDFKVMATCPGRFGVNLMCGNFQMMFNKITNKTNAPIIKIEFRSEFLTRFGYVDCINQVFNVVKSFLPTFKIKVYELHLCTDFQGYDIQEADKDRMSFRNRGLQDFTEVDNTLFASGRKKTGFSFGKDSFMLRLYDKTHQIQTKKTAGYVQPLRWDTNEQFDSNSKVWRLEYQFRRDYLKTLVGKDGLVDGFEQVLNSIPDLWAHAMKRFVHYDLNKQQCTDMYHNETLDKKGNLIPLTYETIKKRKQRAGLSNLWKTLSTFNNTESTHNIVKYKEVKRPESEYIINSFKGVVTTMVKYSHGDFDRDKLNEYIIQANEDELNKSGFSILDNAKLKCLDYMNDAKKIYVENGVVMNGFEEYNKNLKENLTKHWNSISDTTKKNDFLAACIKKGTMLYSNVHTDN